MPTLITEVPDAGDAGGAPAPASPAVAPMSRSVSFRERQASPPEIMAGRRPLPRNVHFGIITEAALRDAPFAAGEGAVAWRRLMQTREFAALATDGFWWVHSHVLEKRDRGEAFDNVENDDGASQRRRYSEDALFGAMAQSYVALSRRVSPRRKDRFLGASLYELLAQTILLTLAAAYPRRREAFHDDAVLKRHVVALCAEWTSGIRPRQVPDDHWVIHAADDATCKKAAKHHQDSRRLAGVAPGGDAAAASARSALGPRGGLGGPKGRRPRGEASPRADGPLVRASYTLDHSPFMQRFLDDKELESPQCLRVKLGLTLETSRVSHFVAHHVPEQDREAVRRRVSRAVRNAPKSPLVVEEVLHASAVLRRDALDTYAKQKAEAGKELLEFSRERARITAKSDAEERKITSSDTLREYASNLVKSRELKRAEARGGAP
ncbi:hypothetical protein M885DRAFT_522519 [Pelagophyceae sp. CCMP2097]|nr:hypothetical protein M885DRAFT_522519 [Pelagophyceae sp. CCMP2097]